MSALKTLKALRQNAPAQDRNDPPLVPMASPHWATRREGSRYVAFNIVPRTLEELAKLSGTFADAALAEASWKAVTTWLMKAWPPLDSLTRSLPAALAAVSTAQETDRDRLGWPRHDGQDWPTPALDGLSPECRREAMVAAAETLAAWEAAGRPYLDARRIGTTYQYLVSCPAFISNHSGPDRATR